VLLILNREIIEWMNYIGCKSNKLKNALSRGCTLIFKIWV